MNYIKPPTKEEKEQYWSKFKDVSKIVLALLSAAITICLTFYGFIRYYDEIKNYIAPVITMILMVGVMSCLYAMVYYNWNMMNKRHRIGYYTGYMNNIVLSIIVTIVAHLVVAVIGHGYTQQNMLPFNISMQVVTLIVTLIYISKIRKEHPTIPPVTVEEAKHRDVLIEQCINSINQQRIDEEKYEYRVATYIYNDTVACEMIGTLRYYLNYGPYDTKQVDNWLQNQTSMYTLYQNMAQACINHDKNEYYIVRKNTEWEFKSILRKERSNTRTGLIREIKEYLD
mgnify:CR=1 FL=1